MENWKKIETEINSQKLEEESQKFNKMVNKEINTEFPIKDLKYQIPKHIAMPKKYRSDLHQACGWNNVKFRKKTKKRQLHKISKLKRYEFNHHRRYKKRRKQKKQYLNDYVRQNGRSSLYNLKIDVVFLLFDSYLQFLKVNNSG